MNIFREIIRRLPATAIGVSAAIITAGIALSTMLSVFGGIPLYIVQLATFTLALALVLGTQLAAKLNIGLPITRHEVRLVAIASVVST